MLRALFPHGCLTKTSPYSKKHFRSGGPLIHVFHQQSTLLYTISLHILPPIFPRRWMPILSHFLTPLYQASHGRSVLPMSMWAHRPIHRARTRGPHGRDGGAQASEDVRAERAVFRRWQIGDRSQRRGDLKSDHGQIRWVSRWKTTPCRVGCCNDVAMCLGRLCFFWWGRFGFGSFYGGGAKPLKDEPPLKSGVEGLLREVVSEFLDSGHKPLRNRT